jgi:hypothetical protein
LFQFQDTRDIVGATVPTWRSVGIGTIRLRGIPAEAAVHLSSQNNGYSLSRGKSLAITVAFACVRAGLPKNTRNLTDCSRIIPLRGSMRNGCPVRVMVNAVDSGRPDADAKIRNMMDGSETHNHSPAVMCECLRAIRAEQPKTTQFLGFLSVQYPVPLQTMSRSRFPKSAPLF